MLKTIAVVSALSVGAVLSNATILVDQDPSTGPYGGGWEDLVGSQILADSFTLGQSATINEYDFFSTNPSGPTTYDLTLYSDSGSNSPGATLLNLSSLTPVSYTLWGDQSGTPVYEVVFTGLSINVNAGTMYWIDVAGNGSDAALASTNPSSNGDGYLSFESSPAGPWNTINSIGDVTYEMQGTVAAPEPVSLSILGMGLVGLLKRRSRR